MTASNLTRRELVEGTLLAAGATAAATMATSAVADEAAQAPAADEPLPNAEPIPPVDPPAAWDKEADVIIVGAGGGGLVAALRATEMGFTPILIEASGTLGGLTQQASLILCQGGSRFQVENGGPVFDDMMVDMVADQLNAATGYTTDDKLMRMLVKRAPEVVDYIESQGIELEFDVEFSGGATFSLIPKGAEEDGVVASIYSIMTNLFAEKLQQAGVEILTLTKAEALVQDAGTVVGVKASDSDGNELYLRGDKGVILTCGGFTGNHDMLKKWVPTAEHCAAAFSWPYDAGDGVRMAQGMGAEMVGYDSYCGGEGGVDGEGDYWFQNLYAGYTQMIRQPFPEFNMRGDLVRYWDPADSGFIANIYQARGEMAQPGFRTYIVMDANYESTVALTDQGACRRPMTPDKANIDRVQGPHDWREGVVDGLEMGLIKKADTLAELAEQLGIDPDILEKAVADWNELCASGASEPVKGFKPQWLIPITDPPFMGAKKGVFLQSTGCGVLVDPQMRAINTAGYVIPGLYCGFHVAGGAYGICSNGNTCNATGDGLLSMLGGYVAAETALMGVQE